MRAGSKFGRTSAPRLPRRPIGNCHGARKTALASGRPSSRSRDQLSMCFTVEIGHLPCCPLIAMRSPCAEFEKLERNT
jgi:hypothetical protein